MNGPDEPRVIRAEECYLEVEQETANPLDAPLVLRIIADEGSEEIELRLTGLDLADIVCDGRDGGLPVEWTGPKLPCHRGEEKDEGGGAKG